MNAPVSITAAYLLRIEPALSTPTHSNELVWVALQDSRYGTRPIRQTGNITPSSRLGRPTTDRSLGLSTDSHEAREHGVERMSRARRSVNVWLQGGLGNQLFQLNAGLIGAELSQLPIRLSTASYLRDRKRRFELTPISEGIRRESLVRSLSFGSPYSKGHLRSTTPRGGLRIRSSLDHDISAGDLLVGFFQDQASLRWGTAPTRELIERAALSKVGADLTQRISGSVVAHVRRGDYVTLESARKTFGEISATYYRHAFEMLGVSGREVYFFTDDADYVGRTFKVRREMIVTESDLPSPLETIRVMAKAGAIVIPNSTFSWWASEFVAQQGRVLAPSTWFFDRPEHLWPSRPYWTLVEN